MNVKKMLLKAGWKIKKHSPEILLVGGLIAGGAAIVTACVQTTKASDILEEHAEAIEKAHLARKIVVEEERPDDYTERDEKMNVIFAYRDTAWKMVKLYALPAALCALSTAAILASYGIMRRRNLALTAAYTSLYGAFKAYRTRVREEEGEDADFHYLTGSEKVEITTMSPKENGGEPVKKEIEVLPPGFSPYAIIFDKRNPNFMDDEIMDMYWINCLAESLESKKNYSWNHAAFWNDLIKMGQFPPESNPLTVQEGQMIGWHKGLDSGKIDLRPRKVTKMDDSGRKETYYVLDPNVDGPILDLIDAEMELEKERRVNLFRRSSK